MAISTTMLLTLVLAAALQLSYGFIPLPTPNGRVVGSESTTSGIVCRSSSPTALCGVLDDVSSFASDQIAKPDRTWNFNNGRSPWGFKDNAEVWNGRVAQVAFVWVLLQEAIFGKGVVQGIQDGDWGAYIGAGTFGVSVLVLTGWLALKGDESDIIF
mmetsp:Transcript_27326/g.54554  ORF Transcript_27326/g.54554 Transcript_27326/m.54554 type:complete len:157 (-) Transcript_27326:54-524(-)